MKQIVHTIFREFLPVLLMGFSIVRKTFGFVDGWECMPKIQCSNIRRNREQVLPEDIHNLTLGSKSELEAMRNTRLYPGSWSRVLRRWMGGRRV